MTKNYIALTDDEARLLEFLACNEVGCCGQFQSLREKLYELPGALFKRSSHKFWQGDTEYRMEVFPSDRQGPSIGFVKTGRSRIPTIEKCVACGRPLERYDIVGAHLKGKS
jgi:hypothetical protein